MRKKQWLVFAVLFFLNSLILGIACRRPDIRVAEIGSLPDLAFWIDNNIEQAIALIFMVLATGCFICAYWEED